MKHSYMIIVILILLLIGAGLFWTHLSGSRAPIVFSVVASAVITFFFLLYDVRNSSSRATFDDCNMRKAIAGSIVVEYLVLVGLVSFYNGGTDELSPITQTLITNFTAIVGVVVAFYLGSSTYLEAQERKNRSADKDAQIEKSTTTQHVNTADPKSRAAD